MYELDKQLGIYFVLENLDKIMHLRFNFDACPMHSPFGFVHLTHQNHLARLSPCDHQKSYIRAYIISE